MTERFYIKIIKSGSPGYWYADAIGEIVECIEETEFNYILPQAPREPGTAGVAKDDAVRLDADDNSLGMA